MSITILKKIQIVDKKSKNYGGKSKMNIDLPNIQHNEDFYIWFSREEKKEYYSTPLYFYKASFDMDYDNHIRKVFWSEKDKTDRGLKHPATLYFPFVDKLGLFLLRFINADLSTYETAYKDFFYAYGFEILKDVDQNYDFKLKGNYGNDESYLKETKKIYENLKEQLIDIQENIKDAVNYIYNIENKEELKNFTYEQRYAVYLIKRKGKLYLYKKNDNVIEDSYSNKYNDFTNISDQELLKGLQEQSMLISMANTHKSNDISSICYVILEELSKIENYPIKKCQNCGMYFIPVKKVDEIYCDYLKEDGKTCREKGAMATYNKKIKDNEDAYAEYRKIYLQKHRYMLRHKKEKNTVKEFDNWKAEAKLKLKLLKQGKLTEKEVNKWLADHK